MSASHRPCRWLCLCGLALALLLAGCDCAAPAVSGNPDLPDAGPGTACGACQTDAQCDKIARCIAVSAGKACVPLCDPKKTDCPAGFTCAVPPEGGAAACVPEGGTCCIDHDRDHYGRGVNCLGPDCNDADPDVKPGAAELCNLVDDNCDGQVDEGFAQLTCGIGACARTVNACEQGLLQTCVPGFGTQEVCNGKDDDCNGAIDDGNPGGGAACSTGWPGPCAAGISACMSGAIACTVTVAPGSRPEICNHIDDDCNGLIDDAPASQLCPPTASVQTAQCITSACSISACVAGAFDVDGVYANGCECLDDTAKASCGAAGALTLASGGTVTHSGKVPASGGSDWVQVNLPAGGVGSPLHVVADFTTNDASDFRLEVLSGGSCASAADCPGPAGVTTWEVNFNYVAGAGCCSDTDPRPTVLYLRIFRASAMASCGNYTLRVQSL